MNFDRDMAIEWVLKGAMPLGFCCFRLILRWRHNIVPYKPMHKMLLYRRVYMEKISNKLRQGTLAIIDLLVIFTGIAYNLKISPNFFQFHSVFILAIDSKRWQETVSMPSMALNNKHGHIIFGIQLIRRKFLSFLKLKHWTTNNYRRSGLGWGEGTQLICEQFLQGPTWTNNSEGKPHLGVDQN